MNHGSWLRRRPAIFMSSAGFVSQVVIDQSRAEAPRIGFSLDVSSAILTQSSYFLFAGNTGINRRRMAT